tara:strand:+ start:51 stop:1466 length:1416 start_codon:yes stop_codon:yes gene_type:complete
MDYKRLTEYPQTMKYNISISELKRNWSGRVEAIPDELQRGEVASDIWAGEFIASIYLSAPLDKWTWTLQSEVYKAKNVYGKVIDAEYKNCDGLQRWNAIVWFSEGKKDGTKIKLPKGIEVVYKGKRVDLSGLTYDKIDKKYPGLNNKFFDSFQIEISACGSKGNYCTPYQETYLFKNILNNGNPMTGQQWRNPTVSRIAEYIRNTARLKPNKLFKDQTGKLMFDFNNSKMQFDEYLAMICHYIIYGSTKSLMKGSLDEMYEDTKLEKSLSIHSGHYQKTVNLKSVSKKYTNFIYEILKKGDKTKVVGKQLMYSLLYYTDIHLRTGLQNTFNYDKLREQFFRLHAKMIKPRPNGDKTVFRSALSSQSLKNIQQAVKEWEEKLDVENELKYVIVRDSKRGFSPQEIEYALQEQGNVCAVDGKPLSLKDAIGGHNIAWSKSGLTILDNCIAIRKEHNDDMGTQSLEEYKTNKEL